MIDIRDYPEAVEAVNAIVSNGGAAEIKIERSKERLVVVELSRQVKKTTPVKKV